jgi:2'-5' RNA ligase
MVRYAIYFAPPSTSRLWRFGCAALLYDALSGRDATGLDHPECQNERWQSLTTAPRHYGFHATIKAPFALMPGRTEDDLLDALSRFAQTREPFELSALSVEHLNSFIALTPTSHSSEIAALEAATVIAFDEFRAPLAPAYRQRRLKDPLSDRQITQLNRYGYPYVLADFRFHMTLTRELTPGECDFYLPLLREIYARYDEPVPVDALTLFRQKSSEDRFTVLHRFPFGTG